MGQTNPGGIIVSLTCKKIEAIQNMAHLGDTLAAADIVQVSQDERSLRIKRGMLKGNRFCGFRYEQGMFYPGTRVVLLCISNESCSFFK